MALRKWRDSWTVDKLSLGSYAYEHRDGRTFVVERQVRCRSDGPCRCYRCSWTMSRDDLVLGWYATKRAARAAGKVWSSQ